MVMVNSIFVVRGYPAIYAQFRASGRKMAERFQKAEPRKNTKLLITLFYQTQIRQPSLLSRFVMVSAKTYLFVYEQANYS